MDKLYMIIVVLFLDSAVYGESERLWVMYRKYMAILVFINLIALFAVLSVAGIDVNRILADPAFLTKVDEESVIMVQEENYSISRTASGKRIVSYNVSEREDRIILSDEDYEVLLRIVEAEAGGEDEEGKMLVANVVLNRVNNDKFPDTVKEVVFQREKGRAQFSPVYNGRYERVKISEGTKQAVERVLSGEDISQGALYFAARKYANPDKMRWFDEKLDFLFVHGGHEFFTEKNLCTEN
ncbi:MAG: cell wall hydrolase [Lachnospiraceae bacterium]